MAGQNIIEVTDENFNAEVVGSKELFLIDFWATWCAPCLAIAPHVDAVATQYEGKVRVGKLNVDSYPNTAGAFGVRSIPTLILFKGGKPVDQVIGAVSKSKIEEMINRHAS